MKHISCRECKDTHTSLHIKKNGFTYYKCHHCGIIFLNFTLQYEQFIKSFYTKGYFSGNKKRSGYYNYGQNKNLDFRNYLPIVSQIKSYLPQRGKHLDIGTAYGFLLEVTRDCGFQVYGVEPSEFAAGIAQKKFGKRVIKSSFEKARFPKNTFSLITMFDVLEHVSSPSAVLHKISSLLSPDGLLVIWTCDQGSLFARLCGSCWHFYNPPQHLFVFSKDILFSFLKKAGLTPFKVIKKGKWFSLAYLLHLASTIQKNKIAQMLLQLTTHLPIGNIPVYLRFNDSMIVFARKKQLL